MIADIAYAAAALCALLLIWTGLERITDWMHERAERRRNAQRLERMIEAWQTKDREFMRQQRRIRGEK